MSRKLTSDEQTLWNRVVRQVERVESMDFATPASGTRKPGKRQNTDAPAPTAPASRRPPPNATPSFVDRPSQTSPNMDRRNFQRLLKGKLDIDATLDLHGMTADVAQRRLNQFIRTANTMGHRLLLIITGKGKRADVDEFNRPRSGVLRTGVPEWLKTGPESDLVLQVTQAHPKHGGGGAYYVYLRRNRP